MGKKKTSSPVAEILETGSGIDREAINAHGAKEERIPAYVHSGVL